MKTSTATLKPTTVLLSDLEQLALRTMAAERQIATGQRVTASGVVRELIRLAVAAEHHGRRTA